MSLYTYVNTPNSNLVCCICQTPFTEPLTTATCTHTFCRECILRALTHAPLCPVDRSPLTEGDLGPADPIVRSLVEELIVECVHSASGCQWTGERQLLAPHLRDVCNYGQVKCQEEGCEAFVVREELKVHREEVHGIMKGDTGVEHDDEHVGPGRKLKNSEERSSNPPIDNQQQQQQQQKTIELLLEQNMLLRHRVEGLESGMQVMKREMGAVRSALGPWFRIPIISSNAGTTTRATQIQAQSYQLHGHLHSHRPRAHERIGENILGDSGTRSSDNQAESAIGSENIGGSSSSSGMISSNSGGTITASGTQTSASASSGADHANNNTPTMTTMSYSGASSGVAPRWTYSHVMQGHGHRASLSLPGEAGVSGDPLAGFFPTLGEFGIGISHSGGSGHVHLPQQQQPVGVSSTGGMMGGQMPGGLQINPQAVTPVAPLDLGTNLVGTLEGLRESVVGIATGMDSLGRRSEIALANETLRLGEEIISLRAGVHGLRMQMHAMMMERNAQVTGAGREEGGGPAGPWMVGGFGVNANAPPPRMYTYGGPPNITKL